MVLQVAAAREAIGDADFFLIARTDARATSSKRGLDEAINRANIYLVCNLHQLCTSSAQALHQPWCLHAHGFANVLSVCYLHESLCSLCAHVQQLNMPSKQDLATEVPLPVDSQTWLMLPA